MEIDDAPEEPAPPLGPGPKLGTVVAMVDFRPPAETGQQTYYQDHNARLEAQRRKADATERRVLETFYGVPASTWAEGEPRVNRMVFIGRNLDRKALEAGFRGCLATK